MFRFAIRDILWLTAVVALAVGWWSDHRSQAHAVDYYSSACTYWRERVELMDDMLKSWGFEIKEEGNSTSYTPPPTIAHADSTAVSAELGSTGLD